MLHPVGGLAPGVYWKRRGMLAAALILALVSIYAVFFRGGGDKPPKSNQAFVASGSSTRSSPPTTPSSSTPATSASTSKPKASTAPTLKTCVAGQLSIAGSSDAPTYTAGAKPKLALVVTNKGPQPCVADLSDTKIELRVYNGSARVWGSHDCQITPGTSLVTLPVGQQTRREIEWSGLSSQPGCAGVRTRVPAGNYILSAYLAGQLGTVTAKFSMAG